MSRNQFTAKPAASRRGRGGASWRKLAGAGPILVLAVLSLCLPTGVAAQAADSSLFLPAEIDVRGKGWSQLQNFDEMQEFALALIEVLIATAAIAFHPVNFSYRQPNETFDLPKSMFLFALIGMLTGFLVTHHGYLFGFVVFGIGGLFRFRMATSSVFDTGQLIIVSLVGLAIGLDLPVMALISVLATCAVLWVFGKRVILMLEVKFDDSVSGHGMFRDLQQKLEARGFRTVSVSKSKFKPVGNFVLQSSLASAQHRLMQQMSELQDDPDSGILDWHVD